MNPSTIQADPRSPVNDFFGAVYTGVQEGLSRIGSEVLPNWVASQLGLQTRDQLKDEMFNEQASQKRIDQVVESPMNKVLFDVGTFQVTGGTLLIMGAIFIGAIIIFKKVL